MVEHDLVAFGQETGLCAAVRAELGGERARVLLYLPALDEHVTEVAVFKQVDHVG